MDLIYSRGLNCHLASLISIANALGVNYPDAFATLWSETDFTDEVNYHIYVSKRVFINLEALGIITETLDGDAPKTEERMSQVSAGEMLLVGMDSFSIPWHLVFRHFHDSHYFFAQKEMADSFVCFDPVYNEKYIAIKSRDILSAAFTLCRVYRVDVSPPKNGLVQEARDVLRRHPETKKQLLTAILQCGGEGKNHIVCLIKQMNALINNRYLFRQFLHSAASGFGRHEHFFNDSFFARWEAVRNGLYKASIVQDNKNVIEEVYGLLADLMHEEMNMAKEIISLCA